MVVRFGEEFAGGSEKEAFDYAHLLTADGYDVDVFTTCARSADTWANEYARGIAIEDATESSLALRTGNDERSSSGALNKVGTLRIFRFPVNKTRSQYWHSLDALLDDPAVLQWVQAGGHAFALAGAAARVALHIFRRGAGEWGRGVARRRALRPRRLRAVVVVGGGRRAAVGHARVVRVASLDQILDDVGAVEVVDRLDRVVGHLARLVPI